MKKIWGGKGLRNKLIIIGSFVLLAIVILAGRSEGNIIRQASNLTGGEIANLAQTVSLKGGGSTCPSVGPIVGEGKIVSLPFISTSVPPIVPGGCGNLDWSKPETWAECASLTQDAKIMAVEEITSSGGCFKKIRKICKYKVVDKVVKGYDIEITVGDIIQSCISAGLGGTDLQTVKKCVNAARAIKLITDECRDWIPSHFGNFDKNSGSVSLEGDGSTVIRSNQ
ncbi:MAG: hypothetical protein COV09_00500 [Candidatus Vogelbacteria bacterium CG10_big_fil_rev_8_21_14_0_10_50_13]|uniref:Uncharacterized protein n=1 Tax=Candidatus Vogelbacteria bacterium CG10_big_fil_rev_8_21_14_0_10_50_13 TaxID=1975044 RepID=A0A2H0RGF7_9BACT|nr:MAG: hypothetical protein COV09_00500 [Candidatus Vogelbacteria bacterium CG10_big_fil_rev_8_21_14_0_10_50_13]